MRAPRIARRRGTCAAWEARAVDLRMISKVGEVMWWGLCASVHSVHDALGEGALE